MKINAVCFHGGAILLDFAGELDGTSDVTAVQVELRVEVLLGCDGCGVVRTGTLGHITLTEKKTESHQWWALIKERLQVVWVDVMLRRLLPHCELCVVQQSPRRTAEESLSLSGNKTERSSSSSICSANILMFFASLGRQEIRLEQK